MEQEANVDQTNYECDICENAFKSVSKLKVHYIHFHREKKFKCDKCGKAFSMKCKLQNHMKKCDGTLQKNIFKINSLSYKNVQS